MRSPSRSLLIGAVLALGSTAVVTSPAHATLPPHRVSEQTCDGLAATIVGTPGDDHLVGTRGSDVIVGLDGDDVITGLGGDDVICGGVGADALIGGGGADRLFGGDGRHGTDRGDQPTLVGDRLVGGPGADLLDVGANGVKDTLDFEGAPRGVRVDLADGTATGWGADTIVSGDVPSDLSGFTVVASPYDDTVIGGAGNDRISGGGGDDRIRGGSGADIISGDDRDRHGTAGADHIWGGAGNDFLQDSVRNIDNDGLDQPDVIDGGDGDDSINVFGGGDTVTGGAGADTIAFSFGRRAKRGDTVQSGDGDDMVYGAFARDLGRMAGTSVDGGTGTNSFYADFFDKSVAHKVSIDATAGTMRTSVGDRVIAMSVAATSHWGVTLHDATPVHFIGTPGDDSVKLKGLGGLHAQMGDGDDIVRGGQGDDVVDAGAGTDTVRAARGNDTCLNAEAMNSCEIVR